MTEQKFIVKTCLHCGSEVRVINGAWLRERRDMAGLSLREMAKRLKRSAPYLSDVERGNRNVPDGFAAAYDELRKLGRSKLVYNKATRTIDEVRIAK